MRYRERDKNSKVFQKILENSGKPRFLEEKSGKISQRSGKISNNRVSAGPSKSN